MRFEAFTQPRRGGFWPWPIARADRWVVWCPLLIPVVGVAIDLWIPKIADVVWVLVAISVVVVLEWARRYLCARKHDGSAVADFAAANAMHYQQQTRTQLPGELFRESRDVQNVVTAPGREFGTVEQVMSPHGPRNYNIAVTPPCTVLCRCLEWC